MPAAGTLRRIGRRVAQDRRAFTLVELIVVISIIVVVMGIAVPALTSMFDERRLLDAETTLQGLIMSARTKAISATGVDSGLFFYVDGDGVQRVVPISQAFPGSVVGQHVFAVGDEPQHRFPPPVRLTPRYVFDVADPNAEHLSFSDAELSNNDFFAPPSDSDPGQRHRNYFTLIFNGDGILTPGRDVLVQDPDNDTVDAGNGFGDVTGLPVGVSADEEMVLEYFQQEGDKASLDPFGARGVAHLVADRAEGGIAINFPSVDGLLVYDDSVFKVPGGDEQAAADRRAFLLRTARPLYINRWTGAMIRGPVAEGDLQ